MPSLPFLLAIGPSLILAMAALALALVTVGLSRTPHAAPWAAACLLGLVSWLVALLDMREALATDLSVLGALLLTGEGFRVRRFARGGRRTFGALAAVATVMVIVAALAAPPAIHAATLPLLTCAMLAGAVATLVRRQSGMSHMERAAAAVLIGVLAVHAAGAALALTDRVTTGGDGSASFRSYNLLYLASSEPTTAAIVLAMFMLIASDFAAELRRMLHVDPLTSVLNREGFTHAAGLACAPRGGGRVAIAIADIDHFKAVNDAHGHAAGDAALAGFAQCLAAKMGRDGMVARIGGEEFAILLPGYDGDRALRRIERLRRDLDHLSVAEWPDLRVTASFGLAERAPREALDALIERADAALYRSKREGRNRSTLAEPVA